ncbi:MAG: D-inositol-3-phosphate glycosyltransferase [Phycisphaerae bacterium]|nr:D-inositol-3-phosphate glycosyltransferase [Phycisphaerae bacterium]
MRVCLLVTDLQPGGTPRRLARLALGLRDAGVEVVVGCLAPPGPVSGELATAGIDTFACEARHARDLAALYRLIAHVRRLRPNLLHATLTHANVAARLAGCACRVPVVGSTATIELERRWHRWAEWLTARFDRLHVVNSQAVAQHVQRSFRLPPDRVRIIPPSVEPPEPPATRAEVRAEMRVADDEFVVLWAGRFDPVKRVTTIIAIAEQLADLPIRFWLAGDGPARAEFERLRAASSAAQRIELLGWREDVRRLNRAADAFIFPSFTEGMPNAVLEAMAAGLPVVGRSIPALRELSGAGETPLSATEVPPPSERTEAIAPLATAAGDANATATSGVSGTRCAGDAGRLLVVDRDEDFAAALRRLHLDAALRRAIGGRAAAWVQENLSLQRTVQAMIQVYQEVAGR